MNKYSVAELRQKTREVLNAAQTETVIITRYDEEFVLSKITTAIDPGKEETPAKIIKKPSDIPPGVKAPGSCVHGAAPGFCKVQKCPNSKRP